MLLLHARVDALEEVECARVRVDWHRKCVGHAQALAARLPTDDVDSHQAVKPRGDARPSDGSRRKPLREGAA